MPLSGRLGVCARVVLCESQEGAVTTEQLSDETSGPRLGGDEFGRSFIFLDKCLELADQARQGTVQLLQVQVCRLRLCSVLPSNQRRP